MRTKTYQLSSYVLLLAFLLILPNLLFAADGALDQKLFKKYEKDMTESGDPTWLINAVSNNNIKNLSLNREKVVAHDDYMAVKVEGSDIVNQKSSGRCWLFAGVNVIAPKIMTKAKMGNFEISEPYLTFWDKMEKANYFLEDMIRMRERPISDREFKNTVSSPFGDGGWWHYFTDLIEKYGIVPLSAMPETKQSSATSTVNKLASAKLRAFASEIRTMHQNGQSVKQMRKQKESMLSDIYRLLVYNYGHPPKQFDFRYESEDTLVGMVRGNYTPESFRDEFFGNEFPEYVPIVNNPTRPMNEVFLSEGSRNIQEKPDLKMLNLPIERLKYYTRKAVEDSQAVWFACDVGKENYSDSGIFAVDIYDYDRTFGMSFKMTKAERIDYDEISPNHAMVISGIDTTDQGMVSKWQVENSWGSKKGKDGYWTMYDDWFDEYVLMVIIDRRLLDEDDNKLLDKKPILVEAWEPFFLALRNLD